MFRIILRIFLVSLISLFLTGCPAMFYGHIKNESNNQIIVVPKHSPNNAWVIQSNQNVEVIWSQDCFTIKANGVNHYFLNWPIPDNVISNGIFRSKLHAVYNDEGLFFVSKNGELIQVPKLDVCKNT